jgi:hypothetical protein
VPANNSVAPCLTLGPTAGHGVAELSARSDVIFTSCWCRNMPRKSPSAPIAPQVMNLMCLARANGWGADDSSSVLRVYEAALSKEVS